MALSIPLWRLRWPEGIPNRSHHQHHHHRGGKKMEKKSAKSPSETCENCSLHSSAWTKCCCRLSSPLTLTFPLSFLSSHFLFPSFSPFPLPPPPPPPPETSIIFHLLRSRLSRICSCAHLNRSNKGCRFRLIKCVCDSVFLPSCPLHARTHTYTHKHEQDLSLLFFILLQL